MTRNSRNILLATTMLAGLATSSFDAAQAGPNGPSFSGGSISGFSSMRMDLNRVGGPGRALSRDDLRIVPLDVKKTEKPKDTKTLAKKDTGIARVSKPKSGDAGQGNNVGNGPDLQLNPAIAEIFQLTGGNIGDVSGFDEWAKRIGLGPLSVANLVFPGQGGSYDYPVEIPATDQGTSDPDELRARAEGTGGAPQPFGNPNGKVADGWSVDGRIHLPWIGTVTYGAESDGNGNYRVHGRATADLDNDGRGPNASVEITPDKDGDPSVTTDTGDANDVEPVTPVPVGKWAEKSSEKEKGEPKKKDSQPTEGYSARGLGRPDSICGPAGCWTSGAASVRQVLPRDPDGSTATTTRRASPSWATDPNPDDLGGGAGNGGRTGYTPQDEEGGDIGGPGNPALEGLNAAL